MARVLSLAGHPIGQRRALEARWPQGRGERLNPSQGRVIGRRRLLAAEQSASPTDVLIYSSCRFPLLAKVDVELSVTNCVD